MPKPVLIISALLILAVLVWAGSIFFRPAIERFFFDSMKAEAVEKAWNNLDSPAKRPLDFEAFSTAMDAVDEEQMAALSALVTNKTIPELQTFFAEGTLSSQQLTLYYLKRIAQYDIDKLNSVLELNPDALTIAQQRDAELAADNVLGPLHGIPLLLKDNIGTGDQMHTTSGAIVLRNSRADQDAFLVQQLRAAGAVILGKANLSEWSYYMTHDAPSGYSGLGGHTRNPYGRFDAGGSSSGSAVSVAADLTTVAVGTETSGSLIYPASQNSVFALKPSLGLVSRDRIIPITVAQDTAGPIARNVTDLSLLLTAMAAVDPNDAESAAAASLAKADFTAYLNPDGLQGIKIGIIVDFAGEAQAKISQAISLLEEAGATVTELAYKRSEIDIETALAAGIKRDLSAYLLTTNGAVSTLDEIIAFNEENLDERAPYGQDLLKKAANITTSNDEYAEIVASNRATTQATIKRILNDNALDLLLSSGSFHASEYAPAGFPAIAIPIGLLPSGEPQSITLIGTYLDDGKLIAAAYAFEQVKALRQAPDLESWSR